MDLYDPLILQDLQALFVQQDQLALLVQLHLVNQDFPMSLEVLQVPLVPQDLVIL